VKRESEVTKYQRQVMTVARFRAALRQFDADTALSVRRCRLTPQRYLLLLMIKGPEDGNEFGDREVDRKSPQDAAQHAVRTCRAGPRCGADRADGGKR
jgi:hypothetical protein